MGTAETVPLPSKDKKANHGPATSTLSHLISRVRHLRIREGVPWVLTANKTSMVPRPSHRFSVLAIAALVSSAGFTSLSMTKNEAFWVEIIQMTLYVFQAYRTCWSIYESRKRQGDEENPRHNPYRQTSNYFCQCNIAAALFAVVSAFVYPYPRVRLDWLLSLGKFVSSCWNNLHS